MGLGRLSPYLTIGWVDDLESAPKWLALVSSDPLATSAPLTAEIVGGTVTRMTSAWTRTGPMALTLNAAVAFVGLPPMAHVAGVAAFDAEVNGNLLFADLLDAPVSFPGGGTYTLAAGEYVVGIDVPGA